MLRAAQLRLSLKRRLNQEEEGEEEEAEPPEKQPLCERHDIWCASTTVVNGGADSLLLGAS
jgi:hypothetical protein